MSFTIMALLPTLGRKILDGMDVEAVTSELQAMSKAAKAQAAVLELQTPSAPSDSSASSSVQGPSGSEDARSDNGSVSVISAQDDTAASDLGTSTVSWVENMSVSDQASQQSHSPEASSTSSRELPQESSPESNIGTDLSESFISSSSVSYGDVMVRLIRSLRAFTPLRASRLARTLVHQNQRLPLPGVKRNFGKRSRC